jgi:hypothetical protein
MKMLYRKRDNTGALNLSTVTSIRKFQFPEDTPARYALMFYTNFSSSTYDFSFNYTSEADRDEEYEAVIKHINSDLPYSA